MYNNVVLPPGAGPEDLQKGLGQGMGGGIRRARIPANGIGFSNNQRKKLEEYKTAILAEAREEARRMIREALGRDLGPVEVGIPMAGPEMVPIQLAQTITGDGGAITSTTPLLPPTPPVETSTVADSYQAPAEVTKEMAPNATAPMLAMINEQKDPALRQKLLTIANGDLPAAVRHPLLRQAITEHNAAK